MVKIDTEEATIGIFAQENSLASSRVVPIEFILATISNAASEWNNLLVIVGIPCSKCGTMISVQEDGEWKKVYDGTIHCTSGHPNEAPDDDHSIRQNNLLVNFSHIKLGKLLGEGEFAKVFGGILIIFKT
jgi:hypothetical protein